MFTNKVCVITGGANGIGAAIKEEFIKQNARCYVIDIADGNHYIGDISDKKTFIFNYMNVLKKLFMSLI